MFRNSIKLKFFKNAKFRKNSVVWVDALDPRHQREYIDFADGIFDSYRNSEPSILNQKLFSQKMGNDLNEGIRFQNRFMEHQWFNKYIWKFEIKTGIREVGKSSKLFYAVLTRDTEKYVASTQISKIKANTIYIQAWICRQGDSEQLWFHFVHWSWELAHSAEIKISLLGVTAICKSIAIILIWFHILCR